MYSIGDVPSLANCPDFVRRAQAARKAAMQIAKEQKDSLKAICDELHAEGSGPRRDEVARQLLGDPAVLRSEDFAFVHGQVPLLHQVHAVAPAVLDKSIEEGGLDKHASAFQEAHAGIMHATAPAIAAPPPPANRCLDAQRCVCSGAARQDMYLFEKFRAAFKQWRTAVPAWRSAAKNAELVLRIVWKDTLVYWWSVGSGRDMHYAKNTITCAASVLFETLSKVFRVRGGGCRCVPRSQRHFRKCMN